MVKKNLIELEKVLLEAVVRLDIEMFKEFYIHTEDYKNSNRLFIIKDMANVFNKFKESGDTCLESNFGICKRCNKGCHGHKLVGNKSKNYITLLFEIEKNKIIRIIECGSLKTQNNLKDLNKRIYLHYYNDPNSPNYVPF
jgi:hypothetical protein